MPLHDATLPSSTKTLTKDGKQIGKVETAWRPAECWKRLGGDFKRQAASVGAMRTDSGGWRRLPRDVSMGRNQDDTDSDDRDSKGVLNLSSYVV